ncbi:hypothetical protein GcM1_248085 [Golovinomyces cichoracearum]|uniref:Uncharacterized protein n=1 Tax=Golovinomyces cichoracearum TaxID=62708 RepID=A0A420ICT6_9PEZI|nr:hypothetical protein GcM1_248085 [Golovinomyces cichoracearum]
MSVLDLYEDNKLVILSPSDDIDDDDDNVNNVNGFKHGSLVLKWFE